MIYVISTVSVSMENSYFPFIYIQLCTGYKYVTMDNLKQSRCHLHTGAHVSFHIKQNTIYGDERRFLVSQKCQRSIATS